MEAPLYTHDCEHCKFLGTYEDTKDLYVCPDQDTGVTVICRYSSYAPDYSSGIQFVFSNTDLMEAAFRAIYADLIDPELVYEVILRDVRDLRKRLENDTI